MEELFPIQMQQLQKQLDFMISPEKEIELAVSKAQKIGEIETGLQERVMQFGDVLAGRASEKQFKRTRALQKQAETAAAERQAAGLEVERERIQSNEEMAKEALEQDFNKFQTNIQQRDTEQLRAIDAALVQQENAIQADIDLLDKKIAAEDNRQDKAIKAQKEAQLSDLEKRKELLQMQIDAGMEEQQRAIKSRERLQKNEFRQQKSMFRREAKQQEEMYGKMKSERFWSGVMDKTFSYFSEKRGRKWQEKMMSQEFENQRLRESENFTRQLDMMGIKSLDQYTQRMAEFRAFMNMTYGEER